MCELLQCIPAPAWCKPLKYWRRTCRHLPAQPPDCIARNSWPCLWARDSAEILSNPVQFRSGKVASVSGKALRARLTTCHDVEVTTWRACCTHGDWWPCLWARDPLEILSNSVQFRSGEVASVSGKALRARVDKKQRKLIPLELG